MIKFKDYIHRKKVNWLNFDGSHASIRNKKKTKWLNFSGDHASVRKPVKENINENTEYNDNIKWDRWTGKHDKDTVRAHTSYNGEIHDHPDVIPADHNDSNEHTDNIKHFASTPSDHPEGYRSSKNMNNHARWLAGQPLPKGVSPNQGVYGGHTPDKVKQAIRDMSATFTKENTNRIPITSYSGVPDHVGKTLLKSKYGDIHHMPGFLSTTTNQGIAAEYARSYNNHSSRKPSHILQLHILPGAGRSIVHHSRFPENEITLHHGAKMEYLYTDTHPGAYAEPPTHVHHMVVHPEYMPLEQYPNYAEK